MKRTFALIYGAVFCLFVTSTSQAVTISVNPMMQFAAVGSSVDVALTISGLADGAALSLSAFDLNVDFDPAILEFKGAAFGDSTLGDQLDLFGLGSLTSATPGFGTVNLVELSFDLPSDLDTLQAGSFSLASLTFNTLSLGISSLNISVNALGDSLGDPLTANVLNGSVAAVPEPSSLLLLCTGVFGLVLFVRKLGRIRLDVMN